jgi:hypothetical protein
LVSIAILKNSRNTEADELTVYAVGSRYPDDFYMPTLQETQKAISLAEEVKKIVLEKMRLQHAAE